MSSGLNRANTFGRRIGLGAAPDPSVADSVMQCGFSQVPVIEYVTWTTQVPLTDTELSQTFANEVSILQNPKQVAGIDAVDSSFIVNGILQADMVVAGFGIHVFGEPQSFTQTGNVLIPAPGTAIATPVSPDVFTTNDVQVLGVPAESDLVPGILKWGHSDWEAAWHFANAYQFEWLVHQRQLLINELTADVCYFGPYAEAVAAGTSEVDVIEYARQVNNRYRSKQNAGGPPGGGVFVPINARRVGSVNGPPAPAGSAGNVGVFHPTRDFDLATVTHGGLRNQGGAACCSPFRKLPRPVLLEAGIPIGMQLRVQDNYHHQQFLRHMSISGNQGGNLETITSDVNDTGLSVAPGATAFMPELTLDQGANQFSGQQVTTSRVMMKGGVIKFAILIKGYEVWGPWKQYIVNNMSNYIASANTPIGTSGTPAFAR